MPADFDPAIQSEEIAFKQDDLIPCQSCTRANPPNRSECIYCGAGLGTGAGTAENVSFRTLESWELGTNLILAGAGDVEAAAKLLSLDADRLRGILETACNLPAARVNINAADIIGTELRDTGFAVTWITDDVLAVGRPAVRLAAMEICHEKLVVVDFNTRDRAEYAWNEIRLIVTGAVSTGKIDSMEQRGLRKTVVAAETVTSADEAVFDIFFGEDTMGNRVYVGGFDYSCLGDDMGPLATKNISKLVELLGSRSGATVIEDYRRVRHLLTGIWDVESRKDLTGMQQVGFGKRQFGVVHSTNNIEQFTRFSRLQRSLL